MGKKVILVTGASRGIGLAISNLLKKNGYKVIAPTRQALNLEDSQSITNFLAKNPKLKLYALINNAGINKPQWIEEIDDHTIQETFQVNLVAPILLIQELVPLLKKNKISHIVNISSIFGVVARGKQVLYTASKFGLNGVTKALALELAKYNILVNSVCPGFVDTNLTRRNPPEKNEQLAKNIPLRRFAKPQEIAHLVNFLISEKNTYITGNTILIDGGFTSQ